MSFSKLKGDGVSNTALYAQSQQEAQDNLLQEATAARERMYTKHKMGMSPAGTREGFSSFDPVANAYSQGRPLPLGFAPTRYNQPQSQQSAPMPMIAPPPSSATRVRAPTMGFDDPKSSSSSSFADLLTPGVGTTVVRSPGGLGGKSHRRRAKKAKRSRKARRASRRSRRSRRAMMFTR